MKNILFVITSFRHGGTNKSLENLLSLLDTEKYQIDVFAMEHFGPYGSMLPNCTILPKDKWLHALISQFRDTKGTTKLRSMTLKVLRKMLAWLGLDLSEYLYKNAVRTISKNKTYNTVVAFSEGAPTAFAQHFTTPNKIAWIHCDYKSYMSLNNHPDETKMYHAYQSIVCVSEYTKGEFVKIMPVMEANTLSLHNLLNVTEIKKMAKEKITDTKFTTKSFTILSVGRIDVVKRFDKIPEIAAILRDREIDFVWYLIGSTGNDNSRVLLEENIRKYKVEEVFRWLGVKDNPYPYMIKSDLLIMPSRSEACPYVLNEARILGLPVITTNYGSAIEFINDGVNGIITPIESMADVIEMIITNKELYYSIKQQLLANEYDNKELLDTFYSFIG